MWMPCLRITPISFRGSEGADLEGRSQTEGTKKIQHGDTEARRTHGEELSKKWLEEDLEGTVTEGLWRRATRARIGQAVRIQVVNVHPAPLVFARLDLFVRPAGGRRATGPPCVVPSWLRVEFVSANSAYLLILWLRPHAGGRST